MNSTLDPTGRPGSRTPRTRTQIAFALAAAIVCGESVARAQTCAPDPPPLTHAPIQGLDANTVFLGSFDSGTSLATPSGPVQTKVTMTNALGAGIFGTGALAVPLSPAVAIYPSQAFPRATGTIEMWASAAPSWIGRATLFSLKGTASLDGDDHPDLVLGETTPSASAATSYLYLQDAAGLDLAQPSAFTTFAPRGIATGDVNGDGIPDLVVANNVGNTLANPVTPLPGEVHIFFGPFTKGAPLGPPDQVIEIDRPQGILLADLDKNGTLDLVIATYDTGIAPLHGFANDGTGKFKPLAFNFGALLDTAESVCAGDVNGDGVLDMMYATLQPGLPAGFGSLIVWGNLQFGIYSLWLSAGAASSVSGGALGASFGDVNADGMLDAVLALPFGPTGVSSGAVAVHLNNGDGTFDPVPDALIPSIRPFTLNATRDLNEDGALDIAVANWRFGSNTTPVSTVMYGPINTGSTPPTTEFLVNDAVSVATGDLNSDGANDLVFHSSTGTTSPVFLLDMNGNALAGVDGFGHELPSFTIPSQPTVGNPAGEGAGLDIAFGGTSTYGSVHVSPNSFELYIEGHDYVFAITDAAGLRHVVTAPVPLANDPWTVNGFVHVQAEWDSSTGELELRIGHPELGNVRRVSGPAFSVGGASAYFRLGTDPENQQRAAGFAIDDFRVSSIRRSKVDGDGDGTQDDFDDCRYIANADQADADNDGVGDTCAVCQADLGFQGPGSLQMSVCGTALAPGGSALLRLHCGPANAPFGLFAGFTALPTHGLLGIFVPVPPALGIYSLLDADGNFSVPVPGFAGPLDVYVQAIAADPTQLAGATFSNAVQLHFP